MDCGLHKKPQMLFAGRFGLAPEGLKLEARETGGPAGFTLADTLACGSVCRIIGVGVVLGLNIGTSTLKMGYNLLINLVHYRFESGWI